MEKNNKKETQDHEQKQAHAEKPAHEQKPSCKRTLEELEKAMPELEKKAAERDEYYDKYMRTLAEFDNARRRMEKEKEDFTKYANESIMGELFPILDSFDGAMIALEKSEKDKAMMDGLKLIQGKFHKVLEDNGLNVITAVGEKFDPIKHEAVMKVESDKHGEGIVAEELRKGYTLNGRVIRAAMVKVSSGKSEAKKEA